MRRVPGTRDGNKNNLSQPPGRETTCIDLIAIYERTCSWFATSFQHDGTTCREATVSSLPQPRVGQGAGNYLLLSPGRSLPSPDGNFLSSSPVYLHFESAPNTTNSSFELQASLSFIAGKHKYHLIRSPVPSFAYSTLPRCIAPQFLQSACFLPADYLSLPLQ